VQQSPCRLGQHRLGGIGWFHSAAVAGTSIRAAENFSSGILP